MILEERNLRMPVHARAIPPVTQRGLDTHTCPSRENESTWFLYRHIDRLGENERERTTERTTGNIPSFRSRRPQSRVLGEKNKAHVSAVDKSRSLCISLLADFSPNAWNNIARAPPTMDDSNDTSFVVDEVSNVIKESIEATIGSQSYQQAKINTWTSNIVEAILNSLTKLNKPFKYIVSCVIMQKNGAGLHTASSCFWDNTTDGSCTVR